MAECFRPPAPLSKPKNMLALNHRQRNFGFTLFPRLPLHKARDQESCGHFSIIQRKVLTPNDFDSLELLAERLERFERHYEIIAKPFEWKFTRDDLAKLMQRLQAQPQSVTALAA